LGQRRRDAGMATAETGPRARVWRLDADQAMRALIRSGQPFTADDLVRAVGYLPDEGTNKNNAVGALFAAYSRRHEIRPAGSAVTSRAAGHGRRMTVWRAP